MAEPTEKQACEGNIFDYIADSFWASLPEQTAEDLAKCKKDALTWIRDTVASVIDEEIKWTNIHLENARRMRNQYPSTQSPGPAESPARSV